MKNNIVLLTLLVTSLTFSQNKKDKFLIPTGTTEITGDFSLSFNDHESKDGNDDFVHEDKSFDFKFAPNFGFAIRDNLVIGLGTSYNHSFHKDFNENGSNEDKSTSNSYSLFPYIKKYFPLGKSAAFSISGEFGYKHSTYKYVWYDDNSNNYKHNINELFVGFRPGLSLFVTKKLLLKTSFGFLGYNHREFKRDRFNNYEATDKRFHFSFNNTQLFAGLTFLL